MYTTVYDSGCSSSLCTYQPAPLSPKPWATMTVAVCRLSAGTMIGLSADMVNGGEGRVWRKGEGATVADALYTKLKKLRWSAVSRYRGVPAAASRGPSSNPRRHTDPLVTSLKGVDCSDISHFHFHFPQYFHFHLRLIEILFSPLCLKASFPTI
jgi:hypothetical protein